MTRAAAHDSVRERIGVCEVCEQRVDAARCCGGAVQYGRLARDLRCACPAGRWLARPDLAVHLPISVVPSLDHDHTRSVAETWAIERVQVCRGCQRRAALRGRLACELLVADGQACSSALARLVADRAAACPDTPPRWTSVEGGSMAIR